jgi:peptidoglycan/xylan/chitin deacetylase (PgdA/CDA1 family)
MARPLPLPEWPNGADVAVSLTFDADAESGYLGEGDEYQHRLTTLSEGRFGMVRGVPRILDLLDRHGVTATFYVPGDTAERHADGVKQIAAASHEIAHHGYIHLRSDRISLDEQREELERGTAALQACVGYAPVGYRSPSWEVTPETFNLLVEMGFTYDSSFMGDDQPYIEEYDGKSILELPVHWSLDDWPYYGWSPYTGGNLNDPDSWVRIWLSEFDRARGERTHITYTMHPEVTGRGYRLAALDRVIEGMKDRANVWFASHREVAQLFDATKGK